MRSQIYQVIKDISANVLFVWIPSHVGIKGNERADSLAQSANRNDVIDKNIKFETLEHIFEVRKHVLCLWQDSWTNNTKGQFYRRIEPNVSLQIKYVHSNRNKKDQLSLTNPRDACEKFARFT